MPTHLHIVRRILEVYGPLTTKQIFVHYPEAGSVSHLKTEILRRLEVSVTRLVREESRRLTPIWLSIKGDTNIWKVNLRSGSTAEHVWMTRTQKLENQKALREKAASKASTAA